MTPAHSPELVQRLFDAFNEPGKEEGGMTRLARLLDTSPQTVHQWKEKGIPRWWKAPILRRAYDNKIALALDIINHLDPERELKPPRGYPNVPGFQNTDTSRAAAKKIKADDPGIRERVMKCITAAGSDGITPDECAERMKLNILSVRPRFTQLKALGKIKDSGERRRNAGSNKTIVWIVA